MNGKKDKEIERARDSERKRERDRERERARERNNYFSSLCILLIRF
jgi:hypothetical protein